MRQTFNAQYEIKELVNFLESDVSCLYLDQNVLR